MKSRLIDQLLTEIRDKNILGEVSYVCLTKDSVGELLTDFSEEFKLEYLEMGRKATMEDLRDYLSVPILIKDMKNGQKFKLLTEI